MNHVMRVGIMVVAMSIPSFALDGHSAKVHFGTPVRVGSEDLPAGDYRVTWTGAGSEVQVIFAQGKKIIATAQATLAQADNDATTSQTQNGVAIDTAQENNATVLQELLLPHLNLSFEANAKAAQ